MTFSFSQKRVKVNWKQLASIDVDKVIREVDIAALQENASNVTFCDIEEEMKPSSLDPNFVKLYRLSQLIIEYLMYSQECLTETISNFDKEAEVLKKELDAKSCQLKKKNNQLKEEQKEKSYNKCSYCPKTFIDQHFLQSHIERRHYEINHQILDNKNVENELKDRLKSLEKLLDEEKSTNKQLLELCNSNRNRVEREIDEEKHKEFKWAEILKELTNLNVKCQLNEKIHQELKSTKGLFTAEINKLICEDKSKQNDLNETYEQLKKQTVKLEGLMSLFESQYQKWTADIVQNLEKKYKPTEKNHLPLDQTFTVQEEPQKDHKIEENTESEPEEESYHLDLTSKVNKPLLVKGMRDEISTVLAEKLNDLGVLPTSEGLGDSELRNKLKTEDKKRLNLSKKHPSLISVRDAFRRGLDQMVHQRNKSSKLEKTKKSILEEAKNHLLKSETKLRAPKPMPRNILKT